MALIDFNVDWAKETKRMIDEEGGVSEIIQADVSSEESCKNAVAKTIDLFGAVHILVNIGRDLLLITFDIEIRYLTFIDSGCGGCYG